MSYFIIRLLPVYGLLICSSLHAQTASFKLQADAYSAPVSIKAFTDDWHDELKRGDVAFAHGRAEWVMRQPQQELAAVWRYDYLLDFNETTAQLVYAYKNQHIPAAGQYPLRLKARYSEAYGIRWQPFFQLSPELTLGIGFSLLKGYKLTDGQVSGQLQLNGHSLDRHSVDHAGLTIDYAYDEPQLYEDRLDWRPRNPSGEGFSIDVSGQWQTQHTTFTLQLYDVLGRLYWRDMPTTQYQANYHARPSSHTLTGQLAVDNRYQQRLATRGVIELSQQWSASWLSSLQVLANESTQLATLSTGYRWQQWQSAVLVEPQTRAFGLEIRHPNVYLRWLADDLNTNQAHRLGMSLGLNYHW